MVLEPYLVEFIKGIVRIFFNPLLYWMLFIAFMMGYKRVKQERRQFGRSVFPFGQEIRSTALISIISSLVLSVLAVLFGLFASNEWMFILIVVCILLSITASPALLSAAYTIGITFFLVIMLSLLNITATGMSFDFQAVQTEHLVTFAFLTGFFLFIEGLLLTSKKMASFPAMHLSKRGSWVGKHHLKRLAFVPFFLLVPAHSLPITLPFFPYIDLGGDVYTLVFFPFIIGFHYKVSTELPMVAAKRIGHAILVLALTVWGFAVASVYIPVLAIVAMLVAIIGKEWITYTHKRKQDREPSLFHPLEKGLKVLAIIPESPGARLGISIGESIYKVNGQLVGDQSRFYEALQNSGAFFKLEVLDINGEIRFINSPFYEEDHHALGLLFAEVPHHVS